MAKNALIVLSVLEHKIPVSQVAKEYGVSRTWVYQLLKRHRLIGVEAFKPVSRAHQSDPNAVSDGIHEQIAQLRHELSTAGLDAGASSIRYRLIATNGQSPAISTIWRSLRNQALVEYTPQKKPKRYLQRFEAAQPNETWQSDFTHVRLSNNQDILVLNFLDDHSRFLIGCTAHYRITSHVIVDRFTQAIASFGIPQSSLTDNGLVYTTKRKRGKNAYETLLEYLGVEQKNGRPNHPQTQGKIERFHQTLKKWLAARPKPKDLKELQALLDEFREVYNIERPHRAVNAQTPKQAFEARPKAKPNKDPIFGAMRTRTDRVDESGKVTLRRSGRMHHIGVGRTHRTKQVFLIIDSRKVMVTDLTTGEILSEHKIEPARSYWPKLKNPDRSLGF